MTKKEKEAFDYYINGWLKNKYAAHESDKDTAEKAVLIAIVEIFRRENV